MTTTERIRKGAGILGELWRSGVRCEGGWSAYCPCDDRKTKFCQAKGQWLYLVGEVRPNALAQVDHDGEFFVIEAMNASELHATGLTIRDENGTKIGPKGTASVVDAVYTTQAPEAADAVMSVLAAFPGAMVVKSEVEKESFR